MDQVSSFELVVDGYFSMNFSRNAIHVEVRKYQFNINSACLVAICICMLFTHRSIMRVYVIYGRFFNLGPVHTGADPFGFVPKQERIGLAYTPDLIYLIQFGSAIRTRLDGIE